MKIRTSAFSLLFISLLLSGCATNRLLKQYPQYPQEKERIQTCALASDIIIHKETKDTYDIVDVYDGVKSGKILSDSICALLSTKGYTITQVIPTSIGYFTPIGEQAKVIEDESMQKMKTSELPVKNSPFYVPAEMKDSSFVLFLQKAGNFSKTSDTVRTQIPDAIDALCLIRIRGIKVSFGKSLAEGMATAILTMGMFAVYSVSTFDVSLMVIDQNTGKKLWADYQFIKGADPTVKTIWPQIRKLLSRIPDRTMSIGITEVTNPDLSMRLR